MTKHFGFIGAGNLGLPLAEKRITTLESPVTGGVHKAEAGEITVLVGGDRAVYEAHLPAFEAMV